MSNKINLDIDVVVEYYKDHTLGDTARHFSCSTPTLRKFLISNNITLHSRGKSIELGVKLKYGVNNISQLQETSVKVKKTKLDRYGDASYNNYEKAILTNLERRGVEHTLLDPSIRAAGKLSKFRLYGDETYNNRDKYKATIVKNVIDDPEYFLKIDKKIKQTKLEHFGEENYVNSEKCKLTKLERYGDENYNNRQKAAYTCISRYNTDNYSKTEEFLIKCRLKWIENGYDHPMHDENIKTKAFLNNPRNKSAINLAFKELLENSGFLISTEFYLNNYFYDFKVDNVLLEINPWITHNSIWSPYGVPKDKLYHYLKTLNAINNGYKCINIWDWDDVDKILNLLDKKSKVYARKCNIRLVLSDEAREFIDNNHLQSYAKSDINIGLYYENELVSIMTFGKPRYNKKYEFELIRYCSSRMVVGGVNKLFSYFVKNYNPRSIISYCDLSKFSGYTYLKLGFSLLGISIGKHWYNPKLKIHITDNLLRLQGFDRLLGNIYGVFGKGTSNEELMLSHDFITIYDAGLASYIWKNN